MTAATRENFLKLKERRRTTVPCSGLFEGVDEIHIQSITEAEKSHISKKILAKSENGYITLADERNWVCVYAITDEDGNRLFADSDVAMFDEFESGAVDAIYEEIDKFCKVSLVREQGRTEDAAKN